jgi:hypothetical protein
MAVLATAFTAAPAAGSAAVPRAADGGGLSCTGAVPWQRAASFLHRIVTLRGPVASTKYASSSNGSPTFLDVGRSYPNQGLSIVIWSENRALFGRPEVRYRGHLICVRGLVGSYEGVPEIVARSPAQIRIIR